MFKGITPIGGCNSHTKATVQINLELLCTNCFLFRVAGTKLYRSFLIPPSVFFGFLSDCFSQQTESKHKIFINIIKKV